MSHLSNVGEISAADQRNIAAVTTVPKNVHPWWIESKRSTEISLAVSFCLSLLSILSDDLQVFFSVRLKSIEHIFFLISLISSATILRSCFSFPAIWSTFRVAAVFYFLLLFPLVLSDQGNGGLLAGKKEGIESSQYSRHGQLWKENLLIRQIKACTCFLKVYFFLFFVLWVAHIKKASFCRIVFKHVIYYLFICGLAHVFVALNIQWRRKEKEKKRERGRPLTEKKGGGRDERRKGENGHYY